MGNRVYSYLPLHWCTPMLNGHKSDSSVSVTLKQKKSTLVKSKLLQFPKFKPCWEKKGVAYWQWNFHRCKAWKVSKYEVFPGPYFPVLGLNTEIYGVNQSKYRKIRTRKNTFHAVMVSAPMITLASEPVSTADSDRALTFCFSVSTVTTNTVWISTTAPTTSQVTTENFLSMMEKSIASIGETLARFTEGQKRPSSGNSNK